MIPSLFSANWLDENNYQAGAIVPPHGDIDLIDCTECMVVETEDDGSEWELEMTYPANGYGVNQLIQESNGAPVGINKLILAKANTYQNPQLFRIYSIGRRIDGTITVKAQHISYDLINIPVRPYKSVGASAALSALKSNAALSNRFSFSTDITSSEKYEPDTPTSMRAMLLDGEDSIKGTFGGDLIFDNCVIQLKKVGGIDRNVTIDYGVDLIDLDQENNISEMITGIYPYYKRSSNDPNYASEPIVYGSIVLGPGNYPIQRIEAVDLSEHFPNSVPTPTQITEKAREWVAHEEIGVPEVSLTVRYATLGQDVRMHDAIRIRFLNLGVDTKAKVVKYKYNTLLESCEEIEVGHAKSSNYFSLMDASRLRKGLIPPARIQNESITNSKIARGGVGAGKLAPNSVSTGNVELGAIDHNRLSGAGGIGDPAVWTDTMSNNAVTTEKIKDGAVGEGKIGDSAVSKDKIKNGAVVTDKLAASAVTTVKLGDLVVTVDKLGNGAVSTEKVINAAIAQAKLSNTLQTKIASIDTLAADVAVVNKLFVSSAQISAVYAQSFFNSNSSIWVGGQAYSSQKIVTDTATWYALAHP